jgi:hypothetical protein
MIASVAVITMPLSLSARDRKEKTHRKIWELLSALPGDQRAKLRTAKEQAMKDPAVRSANDRRQRADAEYRALLHRAMLNTDPSLKPLLDQIAELKKHDDF